MSGISVLDFINANIDMNVDADAPITLAEFTEAMQSGDIDRRADAVERMNEAGGYENLE